MHHRGKSRFSANLLKFTFGGSTVAMIDYSRLIKATPIILPGPGIMHRTAHDRFVSIDITVPDFQVVAALRISADPCLVMDSCPLTAEIG
jgi:hypothetical protein